MKVKEIIDNLLIQHSEALNKEDFEKMEKIANDILDILRLKNEQREKVLSLYFSNTYEQWEEEIKELAKNHNEKLTFWGVELNEEEIENHRLSFGTVAKQFDTILCNNITEVDPEIFDNIENGDFTTYYIDGEEVENEEYEERKEELEEQLDDLENEDNENNAEKIEEIKKLLDTFEEYENEIFQYYLVNDGALWYLKKMGQLVFYSPLLDCYIWGVTHYGTSWDYVMTNLKLSNNFLSLED